MEITYIFDQKRFSFRQAGFQAVPEVLVTLRSNLEEETPLAFQKLGIYSREKR